MNPPPAPRLTRRQLLSRSGGGLGLAALAGLLSEDLGARDGQPGLPGVPHFAPRAKRVIYLFQSGGPAQMDLFDPEAGPAGLAGRGTARLGARGDSA